MMKSTDKNIENATGIAAVRVAGSKFDYVVVKMKSEYIYKMAYRHNGVYSRLLTYNNGYVVIKDEKGKIIKKIKATKGVVKKSKKENNTIKKSQED